MQKRQKSEEKVKIQSIALKLYLVRNTGFCAAIFTVGGSCTGPLPPEQRQNSVYLWILLQTLFQKNILPLKIPRPPLLWGMQWGTANPTLDVVGPTGLWGPFDGLLQRQRQKKNVFMWSVPLNSAVLIPLSLILGLQLGQCYTWSLHFSESSLSGKPGKRPEKETSNFVLQFFGRQWKNLRSRIISGYQEAERIFAIKSMFSFRKKQGFSQWAGKVE